MTSRAQSEHSADTVHVAEGRGRREEGRALPTDVYAKLQRARTHRRRAARLSLHMTEGSLAYDNSDSSSSSANDAPATGVESGASGRHVGGGAPLDRMTRRRASMRPSRERSDVGDTFARAASILMKANSQESLTARAHGRRMSYQVATAQKQRASLAV